MIVPQRDTLLFGVTVFVAKAWADGGTTMNIKGLRCAALAVAGMLALTAGNANAVSYTESTSATITASSYLTLADSSAAPIGNSSTLPTGSYNVFDSTPGHLGNARLDYTVTTGNNGSFFFLHNLQCLGACVLNLDTRVVDKITNTDATPLNLRFDSVITPGHAAYQGADGYVTVTYQVIQSVYNSNGALRMVKTFYDLRGANSTSPTDAIDFGPDMTPLNGITRYTNGQEGAYDWGETNVNFDLATIGVGEYSEVVLFTRTSAVNNSVCVSLDDCGGVQIVFGDPRKDGTVSNRGPYNPLTDNNSVIGQQADARSTYINVVQQGAPLPPDQPAFVAPHYTAGPFAGAVPEPASWAMMIAGFGVLGGAMRRRRTFANA